MRTDLDRIVDAIVSDAVDSYRTARYGDWERARPRVVREGVRTLETFIDGKLAQVGAHPAWPHLLTVAAETGWPRLYVKDLFVIDREALETRQPATFGWAIRETGTHLFIPGPAGSRECSLDWAKAALGSGQTQRYYWWSGTVLDEVDGPTLVARLAATEDALAAAADAREGR